MPRFEEINTSLSAATDSASAVVLSGDVSYWSSTEFNEHYAWYVYTKTGGVGILNKGYTHFVRAFLAL